MVYYYGRETSGDRDIKNIKLLRDNPKVRKKCENTIKFINRSTYVIMGAFIFGVLAFSIWFLCWLFRDGFNLYSILFNPFFLVFAVVWLGFTAGSSR